MPRALIVDDSKTAQARLKSMLKQYDLSVDVAFSAEEALGFLSYNMPDVIFLDHHMEGMDGLEALKIIKTNPATATIPVVMYTSEKGDVYVGQARALGALDILSKEIIQPSNLQRLLSSLKITKHSDSNALPAEEIRASNVENLLTPPKDTPRSEPNSATGLTTNEVKAQVARLFELHIADVRQQISEQSQFVVRNLRSEIQNIRKKESTPQPQPEVIIEEETNDAKGSFPLVNFGSMISVFMIVAAFAYMSFQLIQTRVLLNEISDKYDILANQTGQAQVSISKLASLTAAAMSTSTSRTPTNSESDFNLVDAIEWAMHENLSFGFGAEPLSEQQVAKIKRLITHLNKLGFIGEVDLDIHFGNVCLIENELAQWQLATQGNSTENCIFLSSFANEYKVIDYLSLPFINFEQNDKIITEGNISLNVRTSGIIDRRPNNETPQEWNNKVLADNKITVTLNQGLR